jgi:hypothetical protein
MAKNTNARCQKWAVPGTQVCAMHGAAAAQVRAKAEMTNMIAQVAATIPPTDERPPSPDEVLLATVELCRRILAGVQAEGGPVFEMAERTARVAGLAISSGAADRLAATYKGNVELDAALAFEALNSALDAALAVLDSPGIDPVLRIELQTLAWDRAHAALAGQPLPPLPEHIPDAEVVADDNELAQSLSEPSAGQGGESYADADDDPPQANLRDEAGTPADSTPDDEPSPVVPIRKEHNPLPSYPGRANPWGHEGSTWTDSIG